MDVVITATLASETVAATTTTTTTTDKGKGKKKAAKQYYKSVPRQGITYKLTNLKQIRKERATALLTSLVHLRGGAKQAAFGTDVAPKALIIAGLSCGNPIFNNLFEDYSLEPDSIGNSVLLKIDVLKEVIKDYSDRITTPVFIGIRTGFLQNEKDVKLLDNTEVNGIGIHITTPIEAAKQMAKQL